MLYLTIQWVNDKEMGEGRESATQLGAVVEWMTGLSQRHLAQLSCVVREVTSQLGRSSNVI